MKSLRHNGLLLPQPYKPRGFTVKWKGTEYHLTPEQEERLVAWVKKLKAPYTKDSVFRTNFWKDFSLIWQGGDTVEEDFDLTNIVQALEEDEVKKKNIPKEDKKRLVEERKQLREERKKKYGIAYVDNNPVEIENYMIEPAGIFMGRKQSPLRGKWKRQVSPEEIELNLSPDAPDIPCFKRVWIPDSMFIARWRDPMYPDEYKYLWLGSTYKGKQEREREKFSKAKLLDSKIKDIEHLIGIGLHSSDIKRRKVASVAYLIYTLKLRVGDEKELDEANTVGAITLKPEHFTITGNTIKLTFLGKDSVLWERELVADKQFITNLQAFLQNCKDYPFEGITSSDVSKFLSEKMKGLTAKVFRTWAASKVFKETFMKKYSPNLSEIEKKYLLLECNLEVAKVLNHKKTLPPSFQERMNKKLKRLESLIQKTPSLKKETQKKHLQEKIEILKKEVSLYEDISSYNLNTSKNSYINPEIVVELTNKLSYPIEKFYNKNQLKHFSWAINSSIGGRE